MPDQAVREFIASVVFLLAFPMPHCEICTAGTATKRAASHNLPVYFCGNRSGRMRWGISQFYPSICTGYEASGSSLTAPYLPVKCRRRLNLNTIQVSLCSCSLCYSNSRNLASFTCCTLLLYHHTSCMHDSFSSPIFFQEISAIFSVCSNSWVYNVNAKLQCHKYDMSLYAPWTPTKDRRNRIIITRSRPMA